MKNESMRIHEYLEIVNQAGDVVSFGSDTGYSIGPTG